MKNYRYLKWFALSIAMMSLGQLIGQGQIAGTIYDDTGEPLIGANVIVDGTTEGTITDFDGTFSFNTSSSFPLTVVVSFTGYASQELVLDAPSSDMEVVLSEGILLGSDVIISASRKREKVQEAPASVSVLSAKTLETSPNPADATRNLVNTQGVQIQQQSANRINISMRGGSGLFGTSVFPIMDYRSLVGPGIGTFQSDQAGIMNLDLNRIEVVRGPGSALYGPGVTQGVVHFLTKSPIDFPGTSFELMGGELSTFGGAVRHATKVSDKFGFKINAQYRRGNEFEYDPNDPIDAAYISDILPDQGQGRGLYRPGVTSGGFIGGAGTLLSSFEDLDEDNNGNAMQKDWRNLSLNTTLEFRPKDNLSFNLSGGFNTASSLFFNEQGPGLANAKEFWTQGRVQAGGFFAQVFYLNNDGGAGNDPTFLYKTGNVTSIARNQLESQLQYNFGTESFLDADWTVGFDYRYSGQNTDNLTYGRNEDDDTFSVIGGYIQTKIPLGDKLDMVLAGRYDQFNFIDEGAFSPRAAFVYKASPKHTFRTSFNRANTTVSNLQLNIDFPLVTVIPGSFDAWLYGNKTTQTFSANPTIDWFTGLIPSLPVGTPGAGLPLGLIAGFPVAPGATLNDAVIAQLVAGLQANPATATAAPIVAGVLQNLNLQTLGFGGALSGGFNIFDGSPLGLIDAPISAIATVDNIEFGYKGLIGDKFSLAIDAYWVRENNNSQFTAISPAYLLTGIDGIAADFGAAVQAQSQPAIEAQLIAAGLPADLAAATAAQLGGAISGAYTAGADNLLNTPSEAFGGASLIQVLNALPFHATTQTQQTPDNGVTHLAAGYRTFGPRSYFGTDLGMEYYVNEKLTVFGNHSWVSKNEFLQNVIGADPNSAPLPTNLNVPKSKFRLGWRLTPEFGLQAQMAFQHDDAFNANAGDFSGVAAARNLVDASVGYKFENGLRLGLTANNLLDNEYRYYPNMPVIGRRVLATLGYDFAAEGPSDLDEDGIADKKDACPTEAGTKEFAGCPDSDGDGIVDKDDKCPTAAGDALYMGCPDSDGDGVIDIEDNCPTVAGELGGCPDADGDGVADKDDNCPNTSGTLNGCPDSDGDGVADKDDACPSASGTVNGCPDSDGDGVANKDDKCPNTAANTADGCPADADGDGVVGDADKCPTEGGIVDENGCPKDSDGDGVVDNDDKCPNLGGVVGADGCAKPVPVKAIETFSRALKGVKFQTSRALLTSESTAIMDEVVAVMGEFPGLQVSIEGHTDSQGNDEKNMELSIKRAQEVMKYLVEKGVAPGRLRAVGFGELVPVADNNTSAGRKENRRVEFKASY